MSGIEQTEINPRWKNQIEGYLDLLPQSKSHDLYPDGFIGGMPRSTRPRHT
ncbi:MAG: hypothetical protein ND895_11990 [Pyrinomonadaceae bacterium]|nr:hypothetical protein [Pyrinomonadaceae bacterium]